MKRFWKIFGISIGCLIGIVLIAALVAIYVVFTPKRLTPIVSNVVDEYVKTEHEIGDVELTLFSTFPEVGVKINGLLVKNAMENAQSDTVLSASKVVATLDIKKYLNDKTLDIHEVRLMDVNANVFINAEGETNLNVLALSPDTTEEDTSAFSLPFSYLNVDELKIEANTISFLSLADSIEASLKNTTLAADAKGMDDISLVLASKSVNAKIGEEEYANDLPVTISSKHTGVDLENMHFTLSDAEIKIREFAIALKGDITMQDDIAVDAQLKTNEWDIPTLLSLLPQSISSLLDGIDIAAATAQLDATVTGLYNDTLFPLIDCDLVLSDATASYMEVFPYIIEGINLTGSAHIDLNEEKQTSAHIESLEAKTGKTTLLATGDITELLDDPLCNVSIKANVNLKEFKRYLESDGIETDLKGKANANLKALIRLSALSNMQLAKGKIAGDITLQDLGVRYDSILISTPKATASLSIPNSKPLHKNANWLALTLKPESLNVEMIDQLEANLGKSTITLSASDVLNNTKHIYADLGLETTALEAAMDSLGANITKPKLQAYIDYDSQITDAIPTIDATLAFDALKGYYEDIAASLTASNLAAAITGTKRDKTQPKAKISLSTKSLQAAVGTDTNVQTEQLDIIANARYNKDKENILLQWNPRLSINLHEGVVETTSINETVNIPHIAFDYSNRLFDISDSHIILGNSDFALKGKVENIGAWIEDKGVLTGTLDFTSQHADINELMALTSASEGTEETAADVKAEAKETSTGEKEEKKAYLVPKNVDITLNTNITEALVFDQVARELGGQLYVKNGVLVLEEMGFICNAAKLKLTAMYKTPRHNHIYVGLDYHMVDIDMQELVNMIPQIDTMMPMLRSFRGAGEFHLAAETYVNDKYQLKTSTTRGACSITGKDLVLLDSETFGKISKILLFNRKTENKIDSISAQATLFKKEIDIYPFCITMDKYMAAVGGRHNLDMSFDYHISLLKPLYIGVDVNGTFDDLHIKPAKCKYAQDFRPIIRRDVETQNATLKKLINETLKRDM